MREYEIVYIFRSNFTPEEIEAKLERYHAILTDGGRGEITAVEMWGKRQLAYPIDRQPNGTYVVAQFTTDPAAISELERVLKLEEDLLRYLIVLSEGELPIPGSMQADMDERIGAGEGRPAARRSDDDDEERGGDEDDEDEDEDEEEEGDEGEDDEEGDEDESGDEEAEPAEDADAEKEE